MSSGSRVKAFGAAALLVLAGGICAALVHGLLGQLLATVLISLGLAGAVLLLFLEVGLSEDQERAREAKRRQQRSHGRARAATPGRLRPQRRPRRPG